MTFRFDNVKLAQIILFLIANVLTSSAEIDLSSSLVRDILLKSKKAEIINSIDPQVQPCDNFYKFACGQWQRVNKADNSQIVSRDKFQEMTNILHQKVHDLLNNTSEPHTNSIKDKLQDFYKSCIQLNSASANYKVDLHRIYESYGEFSFLNNNRSVADNAEILTFDVWSTIAQLKRLYDKTILLSIDVQTDFYNRNETKIYLGPPDLSNNLQDKEDAMSWYLGKIFYINRDKISDITSTLLQVESDLSQMDVDSAEENDGGDINDMLQLYTLDHLQEKYPEFDVKSFLSIALNTSDVPEQLYLFNEGYFRNLLEVVNSTHPEILRDYVLWQLLEEYLIDTVVMKPSEKEEFCTKQSKKYFGEFMDHTIYEGYRSEVYEKELLQLWHEIKSSFRSAFRNNSYPWMSQQVQREALDKLNAMNLTINSYENVDFPRFYETLKIDPSNYVTNIEAILRHRAAQKSTTTMSLDTAQLTSFTPVYRSSKNSIMIPVSLLQPFMVWHPLYPQSIKFATLGNLLAHEMIHGFDDKGRRYDSYGQLRDWWDEESENTFEEGRSCFEQQYHRFVYEKQQLPLQPVQSENIADNAAIRLAFAAYSHWWHNTKEMQPDLEIKENFQDLKYTNWELFFISYAQLWCDDVHTKYRTAILDEIIHAPSEFRVIGPLSNFNKFSEIFKCHPGSAMNPRDKCEIY
ncbi:neprilysin-1 [Musca domestica]|uniref:Neprilysin-1 n=1 Tax=Musca domestica TaxID=7370 RepID=A0A9J7CPB0_MUSDO|nr:neprilysin-1 [Musca domestica]